MGRKKEGNKLLRSIDSDKIDSALYCHELNQVCNMFINIGLHDLAQMIYVEGSKLHAFLSKYQRPVLILPDVDNEQLIWDPEQNVGLSTYDEELTELREFLPTLKKEALEAIGNISAEHWRIHSHQDVTVGNYIYANDHGGQFSTLPLFTYGKRRLLNCKSIMPQTCRFIKTSFNRAATFSLGTTKLTVVDAKTKTLPMNGLTNARLRILVPLQIPPEFRFRLGQETLVPLPDHDIVVINDSFEHQYDNEKSQDQAAVWLSIDIMHPDLSVEDLKRISSTAYARDLFLTF